MTKKHLVIIGNGVAGVSAAQEARQTDPHAHITLIGREEQPYYYRSSLTEWITGQLTDESILARTPDFYDAMQIETVSGIVTSVDPGIKQLTFEDGRELTYDGLCLATGAHPNVIPVEGLDPDEIITYRTLADAARIKSKLVDQPHVVIVGGGVLGLELAGGLQRMGIDNVTIIEYMGRVGRPILDEPASEWLAELIREDGYAIYLNDTIARADGRTATLKSGAAVQFDLLVESVGIRPDYPETPGLDTGKGIRVDAFGRTNLTDIVACGDCVETYDPVTERWNTTRVWRECAAQGRAAGASLTGGEHPFHKRGFFNCSYMYNELYSYIGEPHGEGDSHRFEGEGAFRKVRVLDGKLAGALLINDRRGSTPIFDALGMEVGDVTHNLADPDFDWNTLTGRDWDYRFF
ncbi:FAD-dependent oxidoreductase [bacterium]|nr:FAD-dependent oxidoreductase [bacterium]